MSRLFNLILLLFQAGFTFILLVFIYMFFAILDYGGGIEGFIGLTFFQTFLALIFVFVTVIFCLVLGLPIRLNSKIKEWWIRNYFISIAGFCIGLLFLLLSLMPYFAETIAVFDESGNQTSKTVLRNSLVGIGWFLVGFFVLHLFPPKQFISRIKSMLQVSG